MSDIIGKTLKGYQLEEQIGAGAYGAVYRAVQQQVGREVAIKVILPEHANRPDFIRRFEAEAYLVAQLEHLHIVPLYDYWREPDGAYLVMRLMKGGSLKDALEEKSFDLAQVDRLVDQLSAALAAAHRKGVVHRDLKPANILLDEDGNVYLSDFGIAKDLGEKDGMTGTGSILGSPGYLSPEQVLSEPITPQTDIYSLGVLLYELLVGQHPFADTPAGVMIMKQVNELLPAVKDRRPDLPEGLDAVVQRATAKDPSRRFSNLTEFVSEFRAVLGAEIAGRSLTAEEAAALENPYKGLRAFQEADAEDFFGREVLTGQLLARLLEPGENSRFLAVVGPSGSGKSSVVRAGLVPALRKGALPGSNDWFIVEMIPGAHPLDKLALALEKIAVDRRSGFKDVLQKDESGLLLATRLALPTDSDQLLLVIDQFEELFTLVEDPGEADFFLESLFTAVNDPNSSLRVVVTLRADFYDRPLMHPEFGRLMEQRTQVVLPLSREELRSAVRSPAEQVGAVFEDGLVTTMVADIVEQPGALPLLQYALTELFERRDGGILTVEAYAEIGGVLGALGRRAEEIYTSLEPPQQDTARQLFLRLTTLGEGVEDTRRRVLQSELESIASDGGNVIEVLGLFGRSRLLTFDRDPVTRGPTVDLAHEAMLREWARLREWLDASRAGLRLQRVLGQAAREWQENGQEASFLLQGARLEQYAAWMAETDIALTENEKAFLEASLKEKKARQAVEAKRLERERGLEQRSLRRLRIIVAVLVAASIMGILLTGAVFNQSRIAQENEALALENEAVALENAAIAAAAEREALDQAELASIAADRAEEERDRAELSAAESRSLVLATSARLALEEANDQELAIALAIEAATTTGQEPLPSVMRTLIDVVYAPGLRLIATDPEAITPSVDNPTPNRMQNMAMSPDGRFAAAVIADAYLDENGISPDALIFDIESGDLVRRLEGHNAGIFDVQFAPDGQTLVTGGLLGALIQWDASTGEEILRYQGLTDNTWIFRIAISPDQTTLAAVTNQDCFPGRECNGTWGFDLFDYRTGEHLRRIESELNVAFARAIRFAPDGQQVFSSGWDGRDTGYLLGFDMNSGEEVQRIDLGNSAMYGIDFNEDGSQILIINEDSIPSIYDRQTGEELAAVDVAYTEDRGAQVAFSPNGAHILAVSQNGWVGLFDALTYEQVLLFNANTTLRDAAFTPDGRQVVTVDNSGQLMVWDIAQGNELARYTPENVDSLWEIDLSPDGSGLVIGTGRPDFNHQPPRESHPAILWNVESGTEVMRLEGHLLRAWFVTYSPDGRYVSTSDIGGPLRVWEVETGEIVESYDLDLPITDHGFSADGQWIYAVSWDDTARIWDRESGELLRTFWHDSEVYFARLSDDGRYLLTTSGDNVISVWDVVSGEVILEITDYRSPPSLLVFLDDGQTMLAGAWDGTVRIYDLETGDELRRYSIDPGPMGGWEGPDLSFRYMLSNNDAHDVVLLDLASGEIVTTYSGHTDIPYDFAFLPDGETFFSASYDGTLRRWALPPESVEEVIAWAQENRMVRQLTQEERILYLLEEAPQASENVYTIEPGPVTTADVGGYSMPEIFGPSIAVPEPKSARIGQQRSEITPENRVDLWRFDGVAGEVINLRVLAEHPAEGDYGTQAALNDGKFASYVIVRAPDGSDLIRNITDEDRLGLYDESPGNGHTIYTQLTLPATGTYEIEVRSWSNITAGEYTLEIEPYVPPKSATFGENRGVIEIGGMSVWLYQGQAGETITIRVNPDNPVDSRELPDDFEARLAYVIDNNLLIADLTILDEDGNVLAQHESGFEPIGDIWTALLEGITLPADGIYVIEITTYQNLFGGAYTLLIEAAD